MTVDALKAIYVALGGSADTVANMVIIPDVLGAIATLISAGLPGALPEVKKADEGKVLTVNNKGEWVAALPVSGDT